MDLIMGSAAAFKLYLDLYFSFQSGDDLLKSCGTSIVISA
jgi:hypothetical protein